MLKTYGLSGQQTPGTNRDLKQMEPLNILRFTKSNGQSWISWHLPLPPWEVVQEGESLGDLLVTWSPPPWKFPPCLPWDLSPPPPPLMAPPMALTPAPSRPSPWVNWAATGSSLLVTFVPRTFLPTTRGKVLKVVTSEAKDESSQLMKKVDWWIKSTRLRLQWGPDQGWD